MWRLGLCVFLVTVPTVASADPGVGDPVYGATVQSGTAEFEARYGRLTGGSSDGADGLTLEAEYTTSQRFAVAALAETARAPGGARALESTSIEAIYTFGQFKPLSLNVALYGEYKHGLRGNDDVFEGKVLLEHRQGTFDARLNFIGEHTLRASEPVTLGYAASVDWALAGDGLRVGVESFGDLGSTQFFGGRQDTYAGPIIRSEVERIGPGEIEVEAGWLRAFGSAHDHTGGQARLLVSYEFKF